MLDSEVERLRRLRGSALRTRAVARALRGKQPGKPSMHDGLLNRARCAAWRIARAVSGQLRAHPYASFQKDAGIGILLRNSLVASAASFGASTHDQALRYLGSQLRRLAHELDDVRALTRAADLSDLLGRSQWEIRELVAATEGVTQMGSAQLSSGQMGQRGAAPMDSPVVEGASERPVPAGDWPYLAF
jgi:hypothetical protein